MAKPYRQLPLPTNPLNVSMHNVLLNQYHFLLTW